MPIYCRKTSTSSSKRTNDSLYHSPMDFDSEDSDTTRLVGHDEEEERMRLAARTLSMSRSVSRSLSHSSSSRQYIDPWDLENYIYIRSKHSASTVSPEPAVTSTPSPAGEPVNSRFFYVPASIGEECPTCCVAGLEEQLFCNDIISGDEMLPEEILYGSYTDLETSSIEHNSSSCDSSMSALQLHTPGFGSTSGFRRPLVLPKPIPQLKFPAPPAYEYFETHSASEPNYYSLNDCYECRKSGGGGLLIEQDNVPLYATNRHQHNHRRKKHSECVTAGRMAPGHFGLSKKGLLQIDYSCNWNNLDKYITITK